MTLMVHSLGAYASYGQDECAWRQADHHINKLVKSLKGKDFRGYAELRDVRRNWHMIKIGDRRPALNYFGAWAARKLRLLDLGPCCLVPVPASSFTSYSAESTPWDMACAIRDLSDDTVKARRWLRFATPMQKSQDGGTRRYEVLLSNLRCSQQAEGGATAVLIDDVKTTGSHLRACAKKLRDAGVRVEHVIVAAATVWDQVPDPFSIESVDLDPTYDDPWD